jgi:hypothetical protein
MKRFLVVALFALLASSALAQIGLPWPGPGNVSAAPPVIGTPVTLGNRELASAGTSLTLTTTASAPTGALIVVAVGVPASTSLSISSVTDSAGNTYVQGTGAWNATTSLRTDIWFAQNATALPNGGTITANFSTTAASSPALITAASVTGIISSSAGDRINHTEYASTTTSPSSGATAALSRSNEVAFGFLFSYTSSSQATITEGSGFTRLMTYSQGSGAFEASTFSYQIVGATTALNYQPTASVASLAGSDIATFKGF